MKRSRWFVKLVHLAAEELPDLDSEPVDEFLEWLWDNEEMYKHFRRFAREAINTNRPRFSAYMIRERVRWYIDIEYMGEYKISNNHTPYLNRTLALDMPELLDIFRFKEPVFRNDE